MIRAARHRVGQFAAALAAAVRPPETSAAVATVLPPDLRELFERMPPADRRHCMEVLERLQAEGWRDPILLQAAALHDVGKAECGITIGHRIARVLLRRRARPLWRLLSGTPTGWRRPFWALANHPARGAVWVRTRGASLDVADLIRLHEAEAPASWRGTLQGRRHAALAAVDAVC